MHRIGKGGHKYKGKRGAGILFTDGKQILLLKRSNEGDNPDTWGIPGGGVKNDETAIANAVRETKEECLLPTIPGVRADTIETQDGRFQWTTFLYCVDKPFDVNLSKEHKDWRWFDLDQLQEADLHPKFRAELPRYLDAIRRKCGDKDFQEWCKYRKIIERLLENQGQ